MTREQIQSKFPNASESFIRANLGADSVPPGAKLERNLQHEPMASDARKAPDARRRLVRITSYRTLLCDERNLADKHFTDALVRAGILVDDSPRWAKIEVEQVKVERRTQERTEIEVYECDPAEVQDR